MTIVDLIRHGEPEGGRRYRGAVDDPLTPKGWRQMEQALEGPCRWDRILSSPLRRCQDFARMLGGRHGLPVESDERLCEQGFGVWEGRSREELRAEDPEQLERFYRDPIAHAPPGAEPLDAYSRRVVACWQELCERYAGQRILVICHAGTIRAVVSHVLGTPLGHMFRVAVPYAGVVRIQGDGERPPALYLGAGIK